MKQLALLTLLSLSFSVNNNTCNSPLASAKYDYKLVKFEVDAVFDTTAAAIHGRMFDRDGEVDLTDYQIIFMPEEAAELTGMKSVGSADLPIDTFSVNSKGKFGSWLSSDRNKFLIQIHKNGRKISTLPSQRVNSGSLYWVEVQVSPQK